MPARDGLKDVVDDDAAIGFEAGGLRQADIGRDTDGDDDQVCLRSAPVLEQDALRVLLARNRHRLGVEMDLDAFALDASA